MSHGGNWKRFEFDFSKMKMGGGDEAYFEILQKVCRHPQSELETEITGSGDNVIIRTVCKLCFKIVSEE